MLKLGWNPVAIEFAGQALDAVSRNEGVVASAMTSQCLSVLQAGADESGIIMLSVPQGNLIKRGLDYLCKSGGLAIAVNAVPMALSLDSAAQEAGIARGDEVASSPEKNIETPPLARGERRSRKQPEDLPIAGKIPAEEPAEEPADPTPAAAKTLPLKPAAKNGRKARKTASRR